MLGEPLAIVSFDLVLWCKVNVDGAANLVDEGLAQYVAIGVHILGGSVVGRTIIEGDGGYHNVCEIEYGITGIIIKECPNNHTKLTLYDHHPHLPQSSPLPSTRDKSHQTDS